MRPTSCVLHRSRVEGAGESAGMGRDDYNMQLSLLKVAFNTLSSPSSRATPTTPFR